MLKWQGHLNAGQLKLALVVSQSNERISSKLLEGAIRCLRKQEIQDENLCIAYAPSNAQLPLIAQSIANGKKFQGILCLAAFLAEDVLELQRQSQSYEQAMHHISLSYQLPIVQGVVIASSSQEAMEKSGLQQGNAGYEGALNAIETVNLLRQIQQESSPKKTSLKQALQGS